MLRILSALVLIPVFFGGIWFLPSPWLLGLSEVVLLLGFVEYARLAEALGVAVPRAVSAAAAMAVCAAFGLGLPLELPLVAALAAIGTLIVGSRRPAPGVLADVSAATFPMIYLGVPFGALVALHASIGRGAVLLLIGTIVVSDSAQYYSGRLFGRHALAPLVSPKKTIEGAIGGFLVAPAVFAFAARWGLPGRSFGWSLLVGLALVGLGIAGDLFESLLKRSAGVKDSSTLIPGHGGVLDRVDAILFAAPVFYVFAKYGA